jgi:crossover junction endodeoxyribonuclease RuvC
MTQFTSMGIDLSTSATGIVILGETGEATPETLFVEEIKPKNGPGMKRAREIVTRIMEIIHITKPDRLVVEGYSLNTKNASSIVPLVEIGGVLRLMLLLDGLTWFDPRAGEVKKFVSGKGNTPKSHIMMFVLKRWGFQSATDNIADGYALAAMGLAQANRLPGITKEMRATVGAIKPRTN